MKEHVADAERIEGTRNTARFFTENRQIAWVALAFAVLWGIYGYLNIPKRKDPLIPVRVAVAVCPWPGVQAREVSELVTQKIEQAVAKNPKVHPAGPDVYGIKSITLPGLSIVYVQLSEDVNDPEKEFNDINLKLNGIQDLPSGAGPIQFNSDFGDTAALMLTVASPRESDLVVELRARTVEKAIRDVRTGLQAGSADGRVSIVAVFPHGFPARTIEKTRMLLTQALREGGGAGDIRAFGGDGFAGLDMMAPQGIAAVGEALERFVAGNFVEGALPPDVWAPVVIGDASQTTARLSEVAGDRYSYRKMERFTDIIRKYLQAVPEVSKVTRKGVLDQRVYLEYSQEQLASYGVDPWNLQNLLATRNIAGPGGVVEAEGTNVLLHPSGQFQDPREIGGVIIAASQEGSPVYLRDLVDIIPGYQSPPQLLNFFTHRNADGQWGRHRAVTLAVQMRPGEQIGKFGESVDRMIERLRARLPADLIIEKTSDQDRQVRDNVDLFMTALYEAVLLVVLVALVGFWEWRSALLLAVSIPLTLALTFGMTFSLGIELQQVSIATLIIALGLLVDDPVVAGDAIKRDLALGHPPGVAAWLGPTKLARAIVFATVTNIAAYLPFLMLTGNTGDFLHSLPIVMTCALVASRLVSMTFTPLLGYYLLRPGRKTTRSMEEQRKTGFTGWYFRVGRAAIRRRKSVLAGSVLILALGAYCKMHLPSSFFPEDVQYLFYMDVWLPNDASFWATGEAVTRAEQIVREEVEAFAETRKRHAKKKGGVLRSITSFVGGGGPRFWMSVSPEMDQANYAQLILEVTDKEFTPELVPRLQHRLSSEIPGTTIDVRQLQTNPVPYPITFHVSGSADHEVLKQTARRIEDILRSVPVAARIRNNWGAESYVMDLEIDEDRASMAGVSNRDVAVSTSAGISGMQVSTLTQGDTQIPVMVRLPMATRARLSGLESLYVYSSTNNSQRVPLMEVAETTFRLETEKICRREHKPVVSIHCFPLPGVLASTVFNAVKDRIAELAASLPPGLIIQIAGEQAKQKQGFRNLLIVLAICLAAIYIALAVQFNSAIKPLLVFGAVPYGMVGALVALYVMGAPFGFMAFLGIVSLVGVIVSHVIVLFDFIEVMREKGEPLEQAVLDAGIVRLRPILITVGATILALFPLAIHGGPLWQPLCYAQIGGLLFATFIELILVPVLYVLFIRNLKILKWEEAGRA